MHDDPTAFALALRALPGVGRVAAGRLLGAFPTLAALRATPREQVLHRLKGVPSAAALVERLFDDAITGPALEAAVNEAAALAAKRVAVLAPNLPGWPARLDRLDRADRPALLFTHGDAGVLGRPLVAVFGAPGLDPAAFEASQALVRAAGDAGAAAVAGLAHGFDVVVHRVAARAGRPSVAVAASGLGRIAPPMRPVALEAVRAGGVLVAPFEMDHGPFPHDDRERAVAMAGLATVSVFYDAGAEGADAAALDRCRRLGLAHAGFGPRVPDGVPRLTGDAAADLRTLGLA